MGYHIKMSAPLPRRIEFYDDGFALLASITIPEDYDGSDWGVVVGRHIASLKQQLAEAQQAAVVPSHETQESINAWAEQQFGTVTSIVAIAARANTEMAELLRAVAHDPGGVDRDLIPDEVADVAIMMLRIAGALGFDLQDRIDRKMQVNRGRQWVRSGDGHGFSLRSVDEGDLTTRMRTCAL